MSNFGWSYPPGVTNRMLDDHLDPREKCKVCEYNLPTDEVDADTHTCFRCLEAQKETDKEDGIVLCSDCGENFNEDDLKPVSVDDSSLVCPTCYDFPSEDDNDDD